MDIEKLFKAMSDKSASDLFITAGVPPSIKINGEVVRLSKTPLSDELSQQIVFSVMDDAQRREFMHVKELNFAVASEFSGRFRCSAFYQRGSVGMVVRRIEAVIPSLDELGMPEVIKHLSLAKRGLIIVVGGTGAGKSTTLAGMVGHRNGNTRGHIVCIEDPIEFIHEHRQSIVTQREVGLDTNSFASALKNTLRQAPDVVVIGEIRTRETMQQAIAFAETGHLCLCTLHASNANQALDRIMHFFPADFHQQILIDLSFNLKAMVAQQLIPAVDGQSRHVCLEILLNTPIIANMIRKGEVAEIKEVMSKSTEAGMQTFDSALYDLYYAGDISYEDALAYADSTNDLRLQIKLKSESNGENLSTAADDLQMESETKTPEGFFKR